MLSQPTVINHIQGGLYLFEPAAQPLLCNWQGTIISLDTAIEQQNYPSLHLKLNQYKLISSRVVEVATRFIHHHLKRGDKVGLYCGYDSSYAAVFAVAYLMEYYDMTLADAFALLTQRLPGIKPAKSWLLVLAEMYGCHYTPQQIQQDFIFAKLMDDSCSGVHHIAQGIYISGVAAMRKPAVVRAAGIQAVLRMDTMERYLGQWSSQFELLDLPIYDATPLNHETIQRATAFLHQQVNAHRKVLAHCQAGVSRSVAIVMAYLIEYQGMSLPDAWNLVATRRPVAYPHPIMLESLIQYYDLPYPLDAVWQDTFLDDLIHTTT